MAKRPYTRREKINKDTRHPAADLGVCSICIASITEDGQTGPPEFGAVEIELDGRAESVCENCAEMVAENIANMVI